MTPAEHIANVIARTPTAASYGQETWSDVITSWSTPLPANRPWKLRHNLIRPHRLAARPAWAERAADPLEDLAIAVDGQVDAARAAWWHLHSVGLASNDPADMVTATLRPSEDVAA